MNPRSVSFCQSSYLILDIFSSVTSRCTVKNDDDSTSLLLTSVLKLELDVENWVLRNQNEIDKHETYRAAQRWRIHI